MADLAACLLLEKGSQVKIMAWMGEKQFMFMCFGVCVTFSLNESKVQKCL
jgi:hypothetical protein